MGIVLPGNDGFHTADLRVVAGILMGNPGSFQRGDHHIVIEEERYALLNVSGHFQCPLQELFVRGSTVADGETADKIELLRRVQHQP